MNNFLLHINSLVPYLQIYLLFSAGSSMAQAHLNVGVLFSNGIKEPFSIDEDFWLAQVHVVDGNFQSPPLRVVFKNVFSESLQSCLQTSNTNKCLFC